MLASFKFSCAEGGGAINGAFIGDMSFPGEEELFAIYLYICINLIGTSSHYLKQWCSTFSSSSLDWQCLVPLWFLHGPNLAPKTCAARAALSIKAKNNCNKDLGDFCCCLNT